MSVTKNYESTVITIAEESFVTRFSDTSVLSIPGECSAPSGPAATSRWSRRSGC